MSKKEFIIESMRYGSYVKVVAIDPVSGIEASIVGDPNAGQETLNKLAIRKLHYVMAKRKS